MLPNFSQKLVFDERMSFFIEKNLLSKPILAKKVKKALFYPSLSILNKN
jgi:hypothetical protein